MLRAGACLCYPVLNLGIDSGIRDASLPFWFDENLCLKPMVGSPLTLALAAHCWCYSPKWLDFRGWSRPGLAETCRCRNLFKLVQQPNCLSWYWYVFQSFHPVCKHLTIFPYCSLSSLCPVFPAISVDADHLWLIAKGRASKNLEALKMIDFVLRHERPSSLEVLTPQGLQLLAKARSTPLEPPDDHAICQHEAFVFRCWRVDYEKIIEDLRSNRLQFLVSGHTKLALLILLSLFMYDEIWIVI